MKDDDYWLALAVYDEFHGAPIRELIERGYLDIRKMGRARQELFIRLGSAFSQGLWWRTLVGDDTTDPLAHLGESGDAQLLKFRSVRREIGAAAIRFLDEELAHDRRCRDATIERLAAHGFLAADYRI